MFVISANLNAWVIRFDYPILDKKLRLWFQKITIMVY